VDVTSLGDVTTCLLVVAAALINSFGFDSHPAAEIGAKNFHSFITQILNSSKFRHQFMGELLLLPNTCHIVFSFYARS